MITIPIPPYPGDPEREPHDDIWWLMTTQGLTFVEAIEEILVERYGLEWLRSQQGRGAGGMSRSGKVMGSAWTQVENQRTNRNPQAVGAAWGTVNFNVAGKPTLQRIIAEPLKQKASPPARGSLCSHRQPSRGPP